MHQKALIHGLVLILRDRWIGFKNINGLVIDGGGRFNGNGGPCWEACAMYVASYSMNLINFFHIFSSGLSLILLWLSTSGSYYLLETSRGKIDQSNVESSSSSSSKHTRTPFTIFWSWE